MMTNERLNTVREVQLLYKPHHKQSKRTKIKTSLDAYNSIIPSFNQNTLAIQEEFIMMMVNQSNTPLGVFHASTGGISGTVADIRLLMATALKSLCTGIIISHNHPSGNLTPSDQDNTLTKKIKEACNLLDIKLLDHLIVDPFGSFMSFADRGML